MKLEEMTLEDKQSYAVNTLRMSKTDLGSIYESDSKLTEFLRDFIATSRRGANLEGAEDDEKDPLGWDKEDDYKPQKATIKSDKKAPPVDPI